MYIVWTSDTLYIASTSKGLSDTKTWVNKYLGWFSIMSVLQWDWDKQQKVEVRVWTSNHISPKTMSRNYLPVPYFYGNSKEAQKLQQDIEERQETHGETTVWENGETTLWEHL